MKLILTGTSGNAGSEVLRQALLNPAITNIAILSRRPLPPHILTTTASVSITTQLKTLAQNKAEIILHNDFNVYPPALKAKLADYDAVIWCLGKSANGMSEKDYIVLTHDYALTAAKELSEGKKSFSFVFLSGAGSDQNEKASMMFGRIKGRTEKALACLSFPHTYSFRPAMIYSPEPIPEASYLQKFANALVPVVKIFSSDPSFVIDTVELAQGMIQAALAGGNGKIEGWQGKGQVGNENTFDNQEIKRLARS